MVILHYMFGIPPVRGGGLVRYATDLMIQEKKMGEQVRLLLPGAISAGKNRKTKIRRSRPYMQIPTYVIKDPLPVPMGNGILAIDAYVSGCDGNVYRKFLQRVKPDVIHIHTFMGLHREFFLEAARRKIPIVFTTHDYFGVCPTASMLSAGRICNDTQWRSCSRCCQNAYSEKRLRLEQSGVYRLYRKNRVLVRFVHQPHGRILGQAFRGMMAPKAAAAGKEHEIHDQAQDGGKLGGKADDYARLKAYYGEMFALVTHFHFNSSLAKRIYETRLGKLSGSVLAISHSGIRDCRRKRAYGRRLRIGYLGNPSVHKGYDSLRKACGRLYASGREDLELHLYFGNGRKKQKSGFVVMHPYFSQDRLAEVLNGIDALVAPSQCPETFGLVVLEALSHAVPVVVSENVGAKDILDPYTARHLVYDGTQKELERALREIYDDRGILEQANASILKMTYDFSYERHVKEMLGMYRTLLIHTQ